MKKIFITLLTSLTITIQADLPKGEKLRSEECFKKGLIQDKYVDTPDAAGYTALMNAVLEDNVDLVKQLIDCGANVKKANSYTGQTPLMFAAEKNYPKIVKLLIGNGANINFADKEGWTALLKAVYNENMNLVKLLIESGADINQANKKGETPLMFAAARDFEISKYLIEQKANINAADSEGFTPLMIATLADKPKIVMFLLDEGANPSLVNKKGKTALDLTSIQLNRWTKIERPGIARLLENYKN